MSYQSGYSHHRWVQSHNPAKPEAETATKATQRANVLLFCLRLLYVSGGFEAIAWREYPPLCHRTWNPQRLSTWVLSLF